MNRVQELEREHAAALASRRAVPEFGPGDTLRVSVNVVEGSRERVQVFEGVCVARRNRGINSSFTVRKISYGEGVERVFPLHSPSITAIEVVRRGAVRRAKLYYLRSRTGKRARIAERQDWSRAKAAREAKADGAAAATGGEPRRGRRGQGLVAPRARAGTERGNHGRAADPVRQDLGQPRGRRAATTAPA